MYFVLVVPPISATGDETYYFWVLQKWLHEKRNEKTSVILPAPYIDALENQNSRWEFSERSYNFNQYSPTTEIGKNTDIIFHQSYDEGPDVTVPSSVKFVDLVTRSQPVLVRFYTDTLRSIKARHGEEVAVVTWLNNASLREATKSANCALIFNEFGPFRKPYYRPTAYWDRQGVNGETEVAARWHEEKQCFVSWKQTAITSDNELLSLRQLLADPKSQETLSKGNKRADIGVVLQVETDSNALAYGGGWNNLSLVNFVNRSGRAKESLLRLHPGGGPIIQG